MSGVPLQSSQTWGSRLQVLTTLNIAQSMWTSAGTPAVIPTSRRVIMPSRADMR